MVALLLIHLLHELVVSTLEVFLLLWVRIGRLEGLLSTCSGESTNEGARRNHGPAIQSRPLRTLSPACRRKLVLTFGSKERHAVLLLEWTSTVEVRRHTHALV